MNTKLLLDTNCWMQIVRNREHADEVRALLAEVPASNILVTEFALYSVALVMQKHKMLSDFPSFVERSRIGQAVELVRLAPAELTLVVAACGTYGLDFDDAYQYVAAELNDLKLVSLDKDFDRTPRGWLTPLAALQQFKEEQTKPQQDA